MAVPLHIERNNQGVLGERHPDVLAIFALERLNGSLMLWA